jgi:hypothetical protein
MANLPPRVVAELELNSVNPPPDKNEEEREKLLVVNAIRTSLSYITQLNV